MRYLCFFVSSPLINFIGWIKMEYVAKASFSFEIFPENVPMFTSGYAH